jgi:hypothetical protein
VGISAFMLFVALRYMSYVQHQQQEESRRKSSRRNPPPDDMQSASTQTPYDPGSTAGRDPGRQEVLGGELLAGEGVSVG